MHQEPVTGGPRCQSAATVGSIAGLLCAPGANQIAFNRMVTRLWRRLIKSSGHRRACAPNIGSAGWQHIRLPLSSSSTPSPSLLHLLLFVLSLPSPSPIYTSLYFLPVPITLPPSIRRNVFFPKLFSP